MINWKVRIKNKVFWVTMVPLVCLLIMQVCAVFGVTLDLTEIQNQIIDIIGTVFAVLALLGIVVDPTTEGVADSERAMSYEEPYPKHAV